MNKKQKTAKFALALALGLSQLALTTLPAYAAVSSTTLGERKEAREATQASNQAARLEKVRDAANREIDRRITSLNGLSARINEMKHETDADKATLTALVTAQVNELTILKAKIAADTDLATLKTDVQSITKSYRIYMLVMPSIRIIAAADRAVNIADQMSAIATKLGVRITEAGNAGNDVTKLNAALADMNAKLADAKIEAQAAVTGIGGLTPDEGDKVKMDANNAALKAAREKIKAAEADLRAARADVKTILLGLKAIKKVATTTPATTN